MSELEPLATEEISTVRLQGLQLDAALDVYTAAVEQGSEGATFEGVFDHLVETGRTIPYERLARTDILLQRRRINLLKERPSASDSVRADFMARLVELNEYERDMGAAIEATGKAWPLPQPAKPVVQPSAERPQTPVSSNAALAEAIPKLSSKLIRAKTEHVVIHRLVESAQDILERRQLMPYRAPERAATDLLAVRARYLRRVYLQDPENTTQLSYYTADEIINLTDRFIAASNSIEDPSYLEEIKRRADLVAAIYPDYYERDDSGYYIHVEDDEVTCYTFCEERSYQQPVEWDVLEDMTDERSELEKTAESARAASEKIRRYMFAGLNLNRHRHKYLFDVIDIDSPDDWPGAKDIYQFVADEFAMEVLGSARQTPAHGELRSDCRANALMINAWYDENRELIDQLPTGFILSGDTKMQKSRLERLCEDKPAKEALKFCIRIMNSRLNSSERYGMNKGLEQGPQAFYNLLMRIVIMVDEIKRELPNYESRVMSTVPIVPLGSNHGS